MTTVAKTIIRQIKRLDPLAFTAWGAKEFVEMRNGLKFKTSGLCKWKGYVYVKYNEGLDMYDIEFAKVHKLEWKREKEVTGLFYDQLIDVIDGVVK